MIPTYSKPVFPPTYYCVHPHLENHVRQHWSLTSSLGLTNRALFLKKLKTVGLLRSQSARSAPQHSDCGRERHPRSKASPVQLSKPMAVLYNTPAVHLNILPSTVSITTYFLLCPRGLNMETGPRRRLTDKGFVVVFVLSFKR